MRKQGGRVITVEYLDDSFKACQQKAKYFVGIDPSYSSTGFVMLNKEENEPIVAITVKAGTPKDTFYKRLYILLDKLGRFMLQYNPEEICVVMEGASFSSDFNCFKLGKLSGVIEYFLGSHHIPYTLVAPTYAKKVATGKGNATKEQVMAGVTERWGFKSSSNDICDAYTMAQIARGAEPIIKVKVRSAAKSIS